jgi:multicomponent Na+:H+ antiporter subunit E
VIRANIDVAYRVLHPSMPIRPGIVRVSTTMRTASARTLLANCITLTPGTLTMDLSEDGTFYIHWINIPTVDREAAAKRLVERLEWFIRKILE